MSHMSQACRGGGETGKEVQSGNVLEVWAPYRDVAFRHQQPMSQKQPVSITCQSVCG